MSSITQDDRLSKAFLEEIALTKVKCIKLKSISISSRSEEPDPVSFQLKLVEAKVSMQAHPTELAKDV